MADTKFKKGNKASPGRPKGTKNKTTTLLKDAILKAAEQAGGKEGVTGYLKQQAASNPQAFMSLLGRVLPMQLANENGETLKITVDAPWLKDRGV